MSQHILTVRDIMQPDPVAVSSDCPIRDAINRMNQFRIGSVIVLDGACALAGIFTERDLLRHIVEAQGEWCCRPVAEWMTPNPYTIGPQAGWEEAVSLMERLRIRHLPVVENNKVIGMLTTRELMSRRTQYLNRLVEARTHELIRANNELIARDTEARHNLQVAGRLQTHLLLPHAPPNWPELRWGIHYAPLDHLGGDYYDLTCPDPDHLGILIADASGHSIAAAMVAIMARSAFVEVAPTTISPGEVLAKMNTRLQGLVDERFVTAFYCVLERRSLQLTYANAGHPYPLRLAARNGEVKPLAAQGFLLGIVPDEKYREKTEQLEPGDRLCFYTDGLIETRNEIGEGFGDQRLAAALAAHGRASAATLCERLVAEQRTFRGTHPLTDDVTLLVGELVEEAGLSRASTV